MIDILVVLLVIWFIGACFVFVGSKVLNQFAEGISDTKYEDKKLAMTAIKWPINLVKFILSFVK